MAPTEAKSYMLDDLLLIVMRGDLTTAEKTMLEFGQPDQVRQFRQLFENEMTEPLTDMIERLTRRKVAPTPNSATPQTTRRGAAMRRWARVAMPTSKAVASEPSPRPYGQA